jgi:hypothetical protein
MDIEERELHYSLDAPLRAWRLFRIRQDGSGPVLSAPMFHDPDHPRWPEAMHSASCTEEHAAPAPGCRCGIYGAVEGTVDSLPGYLVDTAYETDPWCYAEIGCTGRVFVDMRGIRAERAEVLLIALPPGCWRDATAARSASELLAERYGVPIAGAEDVPDWVTENVRQGGPPPVEHELDLDLDALGLSPG